MVAKTGTGLRRGCKPLEIVSSFLTIAFIFEGKSWAAWPEKLEQ
jgi:hypothetical protein